MKQPVCSLPWVHAFCNTKAERALCCVAQVPDNQQQESLKDFWNGDYIKNVRKLMLQGQFPKECQACAKQYNTEAPNHFANNLFKTEIEKRVENTQEDGSINLQPSYYDYRFSNLCDLMCKMCNQESSSRHEKAYREQFGITTPTINQSRSPFNTKILLPELKQAIINDDVTHLYWAGGEPLLMKEQWEVLEFAITQGKAKQIDLSYNTNLNQWENYSKEFLLLTSHFKSTSLDISIDGVEEVGSYIRHGLQWSRFLASIEEIKSHPHITIGFSITLTIPGALYLDQLLEFLKKQKRGYHLTLAAPLGPTDLLSFAVLPEQIKEELLKQMKKILLLYPEPFFSSFQQACQLIKATSYIGSDHAVELEIKKWAKLYQLQEKQLQGVTLLELYQKRSPIIAQWWSVLVR